MRSCAAVLKGVGTDLTTRTFRYCPWSRIEEALRLGWIVADDMAGCHHGCWGVLVEWLCECPAPWVK